MMKLLIGLLALGSLSSFATTNLTCDNLDKLLSKYDSNEVTQKQAQILQEVQQIYALTCTVQQQQYQSN